MGARFLGHLERTSVLIHLVDATSEDPLAGWRAVREELRTYGAGLAEKTELTALNKIDALDEATRQAIAARVQGETGVAPFLVSGVSGEGVRDLSRRRVSRPVHARGTPAGRARGRRARATRWRP